MTLEKELMTHTMLWLGDATNCLITPLPHTPAELISGLMRQKHVRLLAVGDKDHRSIAVKRETTNLLSEIPSHTPFGIEHYKHEQDIVDGFNKGDAYHTNQLLESETHPLDYYRPRNPELAPFYYHEKTRQLKTAREMNLPLHAVDHLNVDTSDAVSEQHNKWVNLLRKYGIAKSFENNEGQILDPLSLNDAEFEKIRNEFEKNINSAGAAVNHALKDEIYSMTKQEAKKKLEDYTEKFGLPVANRCDTYDLTHYTAAEIKQAVDIQIKETLDKKRQAEHVRDTLRDNVMTEEMIKAIGDGQGIMRLGTGHLGPREEDRTTPTAGEQFKQELGDGYVYVMILPVKREFIEQYGRVALGGIGNADYTIFAPVEDYEASHGQIPALSIKSYSIPPKKASEGPHKDRLASVPPVPLLTNGELRLPKEIPAQQTFLTGSEATFAAEKTLGNITPTTFDASLPKASPGMTSTSNTTL